MNNSRALRILRRSFTAIANRITKAAAETILTGAAVLVFAGPAWAGPPFFTDDPEPVEHLHWEIYLASAYSHSIEGTQCTAPHVEANFGAFPDAQLHLIVPMAYSHRMN